MNNMTTNLLLSRAATEIEKNGLKRGDYGGATGPTDVLNALIRAKYAYVAKRNGKEFSALTIDDDSRLNNAVVRGAIAKIARTVGVPETADDVAIWSDSTTKKTAVNVLRKAIKTK